MRRQRRVVGLDVELEAVHQAVLLQEGVAAPGVEVVLVLGRFLRLGLDVELPLKADLLLVIDGQVEELAQVIHLAAHVGVEERLVTLAAAPEDVALAAQLLGDFERLLDLRGGVGEDLGPGRGRGADM